MKIWFLVCLLYSTVQAQSVYNKNEKIVNFVKTNGSKIAPTYKQAVCTELVIEVLQHFYALNSTDKRRIRIITSKNIYELLNQNSSIPKGVYFALIKKKIGKSIPKNQVKEGDFVQFWNDAWGHCGIVKSINYDNNSMELYSSFPTTNGYGIQSFNIPKHCFFVRLK
jgi:hypothetical protein